MDGGGSRDGVIGAPAAGFALGPSTRRTDAPVRGPVSVDVGGGSDAEGIDLLRRVTGFLQRNHCGSMRESEVGESRQVGVETRAV